MNTTLIVKAFYCGIELEIICQMDHCSLVRFNQRLFVVDTTDLVLEQNFKEAAKRADMLGRLEGWLRHCMPEPNIWLLSYLQNSQTCHVTALPNPDGRR